MRSYYISTLLFLSLHNDENPSATSTNEKVTQYFKMMTATTTTMMCVCRPTSTHRPHPIETIPSTKLKALRRMGLEMKDVIKLGRRGVGEGVVYQIRNKWRTSEIAKLYCGGKAGINMKEIVDRLEEKTGGVVVHRAGGSVFLYRGNVNHDWSAEANNDTECNEE